MDTHELRITEINDHITLIDDDGESTCYLIRGADKALVIDSANGWLDVKSVCERICDLPLTLVLTHGHCDHVFGSIWFDEAYLHPADYALHDEHFRFKEIQVLMREHGKRPAKLLPLTIGQVFDLGGGIELETVLLDGHTKGSVGFLDRADRILFSGDALNGHLWMQLEDSLPISALKKRIETLKKEHGGEFDWLLTGHGRGLESASVRLESLQRGCEELLAGDTQKDAPYTYFGGQCLSHWIGPEESSMIIYWETNRK